MSWLHPSLYSPQFPFGFCSSVKYCAISFLLLKIFSSFYSTPSPSYSQVSITALHCLIKLILHTHTHIFWCFIYLLKVKIFQDSCVSDFCALQLILIFFSLCKTDICPQLFLPYLRTKFCFKQEERSLSPPPPGFWCGSLSFPPHLKEHFLTFLHIWRKQPLPRLRGYTQSRKLTRLCEETGKGVSKRNSQ